MGIFQTLAGTLQSTFKLGKTGPTLRQGTGDPNATSVSGSDGDIYIQYGTTESFFQRRNGAWVDVSVTNIKRHEVTTNSYTILANDHYIGLNYNGAVDLYLPPGAAGKGFIIKDEAGLLSGTNILTVHADGSETIDGASTITLTAPRSSLTLVFGNGWQII